MRHLGMCDLQKVRKRRVEFTLQDLQAFAAWSRDFNPLHLSEKYSRTTSFGEPIVHGILGVIRALFFLPPPSRHRIQALDIQFLGPLFTGISYSAEVEEDLHEVRLQDGEKCLLRIRLQYADTGLTHPWKPQTAHLKVPKVVTEPKVWNLGQLSSGMTFKGVWSADWGSSASIFSAAGDIWSTLTEQDERVLNALLWASFFVGMESPGRDALFSKVCLKILDTNAGKLEQDFESLSYEATLDSIDSRFGLLRFSSLLPFAEIQLEAFLRKTVSPFEPAKLLSILPSSKQLEGKVALVIGASRGFGAGLSACLASQGCTVWASYHKSETEMQNLVKACAGFPGKIIPIQGDASLASWCREAKNSVQRDSGKLDFLFCNATTSLQRTAGFVPTNVALVDQPLSHFGRLLDESGGICVLTSSTAVSESDSDQPHYVAAKRAQEARVESALLEYPRIRALVLRPDRMETDLTNSPLGHIGARSPLEVAVSVVSRLLDPMLDRLEVRENF